MAYNLILPHACLPWHTRLLPFAQSTVHHHAAAIDKHKNKTKNAKLSKNLLRYLFTYLLARLENIKLPAWQGGI